MDAEKKLELILQVVEFLLQCGFSVSNRNNEGKTPLHTASVKVIIITITTIKIHINNENKITMQGEKEEDEMGMPGESPVVGIRLSDPVFPLCVRPG